MRWKLEDLLAECVPEKVVLPDFRHAKTTRAGASGKTAKQKRYDKINEEPPAKRKL